MARRSNSNTAQSAENKAGNQWDEGAENGDTARRPITEAELDEADPLTSEQHLDEAARRNELTNRQTQTEFETGRDAISGTQNPGITQASGHTHQGDDTDSDMSGRKPFEDPAAALDPELVEGARKALRRAEDQDRANIPESHTPEQRKAAERSAGWRSLRDLSGVHATTMAALVKSGRVEEGHAPGMHHSAEAGKLYRIKRDRG